MCQESLVRMSECANAFDLLAKHITALRLRRAALESDFPAI